MQTLDQHLETSGRNVGDLAAAAGLETERVLAIAEGRWTPSPDERQKIAEALAISIDDVIWGHTLSPRNIRYRQQGMPGNM